MAIFRSGGEKFAGIAALLTVAVFLPVFAFGGTKVLYVDDDASGTKDGSKAHPYEEISDALKHAKSGTEIYVAAGTYKENITIPKGVEVYGNASDRSKVVIDGDSKDPTVTMKHDANLSHVTVKDGTHGIFVKEDSKTRIYDVVVKDAKYDGIHIEKGDDLSKSQRAFLEEVVVKDSGRAGIYSERRYIVILDTDVKMSGGDGFDLEAGSNAWIEDSTFNDNKGSGAKIAFDGSAIWTREVSFRRNAREGVEIDASSASGMMDFKKSKAVDNGRYGIALVARNVGALDMWKGMKLDASNSYWSNGFGNVSRVIPVF